MPGTLKAARVAAVIGIAAAAAVALLLLARWCSVTLTYTGAAPITYGFNGRVFETSTWVAMIALSAATCVVGLVALLRPLRFAPMLALGALAMAAEIVAIALQSNNARLFTQRSFGGVSFVTWHWNSTTLAAAYASAGLGIVIWTVLFAVAAFGKQCPDCAERVAGRTIDCPHCGYRFALARGLKRCDQCQRPVKAAARVCRFCGHRFGTDVPGHQRDGVTAT